MYVTLSYLEGLPADNEWVLPVHIRAQSLSAQYLHAFFWSVHMKQAQVSVSLKALLMLSACVVVSALHPGACLR